MKTSKLTTLIRLIRVLGIGATLVTTSTRVCLAQLTGATSISFQGALNGPDGQPLPDGNHTLVFRIYDSPTTNQWLYATTNQGVALVGGVASTAIAVDPTIFNGATRYLGITVPGLDGGRESVPRILVTAVPYAAYSQLTRGIEVDSSGRVAIGTTNATGTLTLTGNSSRPALTIEHSNAQAGAFHMIPLGWHSPSGALQWGLYFPFAHSSGWKSGLPALILWDGAALCLGLADGDDRPLFNVGVGTRWPQARLDVNGTTRTTVLQITSDRGAKQNFEPVDPALILKKVVALPISTWAYTNAPSVIHTGPMAQDFHAAFGLGDSDKHIATVDADGVALAAIQGLNEKLELEIKKKDARIAVLEERLARVERLLH